MARPLRSRPSRRWSSCISACRTCAAWRRRSLRPCPPRRRSSSPTTEIRNAVPLAPPLPGGERHRRPLAAVLKAENADAKHRLCREACRVRGQEPIESPPAGEEERAEFAASQRAQRAQLLPRPIVHRVLIGGAGCDEVPAQRPAIGVVEALARVGLRRRIEDAREF